MRIKLQSICAANLRTVLRLGRNAFNGTASYDRSSNNANECVFFVAHTHMIHYIDENTRLFGKIADKYYFQPKLQGAVP